MLKSSDLKILDSILESISAKTKDEAKLSTLNRLRAGVSDLISEDLAINITEKDVEVVYKVLKDLEDITNYYTSQHDMGSIEIYDNIKKEMGGLLQTLSTYKDKFLNEYDRIEDKIKKEKRTKLVKEIQLQEGVKSFTQADKMVEADERYVRYKQQMYDIKKIASEIKTKYQFYMQLWQMVFQSVSTASKERFASKFNND